MSAQSSQASHCRGSGLQGVHEEGGQPVGARVVTAHHILHAGSEPGSLISQLKDILDDSPDVGVPGPDEPGRHLLEALVHAGQPPGEVVEAPGPGEVEAVQVNQFSVSAVTNLARA